MTITIYPYLEPPQMDYQYRTFELAENEAITLICPIDDRSVEIQWTKNGIPITTSNNVQVSVLKVPLINASKILFQLLIK